LKSLLVDAARYRSWVVHPFFSNHTSMYFQLDKGDYSVAYPFKFNPALLNEVTFGVIVRADWRIDLGDGVISAQRRLAPKLHKLKNRLKIWIAEKKNLKAHTSYF
jgi:hypothetical protein